MLEAFTAVESGDADAAASNNFFGARFASRHGLADAAITFDQQSLHFAAPLTVSPDRLEAIDDMLLRWKGQGDSPYFRALQRALVPEPLTAMPPWVVPLTMGLLFVVVLLLVFSALLRWRVKARTRALEHYRRQLEHVLDSSTVVLYQASATLAPFWISPNVVRLFGLSAAELIENAGWESRILEQDRDKRSRIAAELSDADQLAVDYRIIDGHGKTRHLRDEMRVLAARDGHTEVIGTWTDLTSDYEQRERIRFLSNHDRLTRLPNRAFLREQLRTAIAQTDMGGQGGMLLIIDLDRFGAINEAMGMAVGDQLLAALARRILGQLAATDLVARSGNDEFCILMGAADSCETTARLCQGLLERIAVPIQIEDHQLTVTASIGLAHFPAHGRNVSEVMAAAELALQQARKGGGNAWAAYRPELGTVTSERMFLEQDINKALEQDQFELFYQPQYSLTEQRLVGLECLIRWQHPRRGMIMPGAFIPFAEQTGQIRKIDIWVLRKACFQLGQWRDAGLDAPRVSVNLSASEFRSEALAASIAAVIQEFGIAPEQLELEITETTLMEAPDQAAGVMLALDKLGVHLSMDDFGTGYSNLAQLLALPLDQLKIDQSLLANIEHSAQKQSVLKAIIALARALDMELIAEGIETPAQLEFLKHAGCPLGQGYLLGRPLSASQTEQLLRQHCSEVTY
ncbi:MAG: EAL domain-containing protein [Wenzhouxiangella sp.]|nr:EAL domain-containing protein [Wenzhouxiangella sp.]TVR93426.1 MAG: EAL domain-containing protein [Wenzhouxiangellaceae bacterium]